MAATTSFTCYDAQRELFLEFGLTTWTSYAPSLNVTIRGKRGGGNSVNAFLPINNFPQLLANINSPTTASQIQFNYKNSSGSFGRENDNFTINSSNGSAIVTLNETQWKDIQQYLNLMYMYAPMIREIGNCVRMHLIDVLTQVGLNPIDPNTNRTRATAWYGNTDNSNSNYQRNNNNYQNRQQNNQQQNHQAPNMNMPAMPPMMGGNNAPNMGAPMMTPPVAGANMPPMAQPGTMPNIGAPMPNFATPPVAGSNMGGGAAPATGTTANFADGLQNMLNGAFMSPPGSPNQ